MFAAHCTRSARGKIETIEGWPDTGLEDFRRDLICSFVFFGGVSGRRREKKTKNDRYKRNSV